MTGSADHSHGRLGCGFRSAVRKNDGTEQGATIMFRSLLEG